MKLLVPPNVSKGKTAAMSLLLLLSFLSSGSGSIATEVVGVALRSVQTRPGNDGSSPRRQLQLAQQSRLPSKSMTMGKEDVPKAIVGKAHPQDNSSAPPSLISKAEVLNDAAAPRALSSNAAPALAEYRGPAAVTVLYFVLYYAFMILQLQTRGSAAERTEASGRSFDRFSTRDPEAIMGERTFLNTLEQMGPFLAALWTCSALVSCTLATWLGAIAVVSRLFFPIFWSMGKGGNWNILVEASTQPYYLCIMGMFGAVATFAFFGVNIVDEYSGWIVAALCFAYYLAFFILSFALGKAVHLVVTRAYQVDLS